jgi:hypothetical protein
MKLPFTGGCVCGALRYECTAEPIMMLKCHCRDCQQITGGGFAAAVLLPAKAFRLTKGELSYHFTFIVWAELLNHIQLRGDERILDIGCGRGAVLLVAAQHLTTGRAVGVDLWNREISQVTRRTRLCEMLSPKASLIVSKCTPPI